MYVGARWKMEPRDIMSSVSWANGLAALEKMLKDHSIFGAYMHHKSLDERDSCG